MSGISNIKKNMLILSMLFFWGCSGNVGDNNVTDAVGASKKSTEQIESDTGIQKLNFAVVPSSNAMDLQNIMKPLISYLHAQIEMPVILKFASNYENIVDKTGIEYDLASMGAYSYVESHKKNNTLPLVKSIRNGKPSYKGIIITHKDSGIKSLEDLKKREKIKTVFTDRYSTSGFLFPAADIIKSGADIEKNLSVKFVKGHDNVVKIISSKGAEIGACYQGAVEKYLSPDKVKNIVVLQETDDIPGDPIAIGKNIIDNKDLKKKLLDAFINLKNSNILNSLAGGLEGYAPAEDSDYNIMREKIDLINKHFK
ncbi:MAG TPA: phosphate/phosphite/phosphonate ABC transporter substrate-binding protein [bacterium]|nr:phosphate/phosphite/phosphonate ABC transporter substrate-binding protein [bacterium]HPN29341.1 phosphate/phosphite/phosphonate ABC transporter substrate-binding protein [bacterium]